MTSRGRAAGGMGVRGAGATAGGWRQRIAFVVFAAALLAAVGPLTRAWDKPLLGPHAFRQTQTAISAYYMARAPGVFLSYETPVLGRPWQIPMEVPYFQWLVARWHNATGMPLDAAGRFVSVVFLLACLWPVWALLRALGAPAAAVYFTWALFLSSPLYLFWGNAFLIETTGLFFSLGMAAYFAEAARRRSLWRCGAGVLFGALAITCKATTWAVAAAAAAAVVAYLSVWPAVREAARSGRWNVTGILKRREVALACVCAAGLGVCFAAGKVWLDYADSLKAQNPFARELILANSEHQKRWNYGTWEQKTDPAVWRVIWEHVSGQILPHVAPFGPFFLPLLIAAGLLFARVARVAALIFLGAFAAGPVVFTNLYFEHSYYWTANGVWLLMAGGVLAGDLFQARRGGGSRAFRSPAAALARVVLAPAVVAVLVVAGVLQWHRTFAPVLRQLPAAEALRDAWTRPVQEAVAPGRTLIVLGHDWSPVALYYAERKGVAFPRAAWIPFPGPQMDEALGRLRDAERPGGVVVAGEFLDSRNEAAVRALLERLGARMIPERTAFGLLFRID